MSANLYGTLVVEGDREYEVTVVQNRTATIWVLSNEGFYSKDNPTPQNDIVAVLRTTVGSQSDGYGKYYIVSRVLDSLNNMVHRAVVNNAYNLGFFVTGEYKSETSDDLLEFKTFSGGRHYIELRLVSEGFKLNVSEFARPLPCKLPKLAPIADDKAESAIVANLGVKSAAMLRKAMGSRLDFLDHKQYHLIDSNEKFRAMFLDFLRYVQDAAKRNVAVLVGLDTETTGLKMLNLSPDNPVRDHVVAIPFSWRDDEAYLICMDMAYFGNVDANEVYPLFETVFRRNPDFSFGQIDIEYEGEHFNFSRQNIDVTGANVGFDTQGFLVHESDIYFDDDLQILLYNLATDWVQGKNSLKAQTRRLIGDETLELEELYGAKNKDKFKYLQDPLLALWYGAADADYSRLVTKKALSMTSPTMLKLCRKYDMTLCHTLAKSAFIGMPVDTAGVHKQGAKVEADMEALRHFIYRYAYLANKDDLEQRETELRKLLYDRGSSQDKYNNRGGKDETDMIAALLDADEEDKEFQFKLTPANKKHLVYDMLHYPVMARSEVGEPKLDKNVRKKLLAFNRDNPVEILKEDLDSMSDPEHPLIEKKVFNIKRYPLMLAFDKYAVLEKEYCSYYRPLMENDLEGKMFYGFNMARAATRRILSPGQTMKGSLKSLTIAPPGKLYVCFDVSQMEYRLMASLAFIRTKEALSEKYPVDWKERLAETNIAKIVTKMTSEEADYHIETASMMTGTPQHLITKKVRKSFKKVGFGIPYGLSIMSLCEDLHGDTSQEHMKETQDLYNLYCDGQQEIMELIESARDGIFKPADISQAQRDWMELGETYVGKVFDLAGFYRLFILEGLTIGKTSSYRRKGGNFKIQGGAAELFRRMLYNLTVALAQAEMLKQIDLHMLVHDEGDFTADENIDMMHLISIMYKSCVLRYPDHIPYFIGIGVGHNWLEAKDDGAELPIRMVRYMVDAWEKKQFDIPRDGRQAENLLALKRHYMCDRIEEELHSIIPGLTTGYVWTDEDAKKVDEQFTNYVVRAYLDIFANANDPLKKRLQDWQQAREEYGFGVKFLTRKFKDYSNAIQDMDLDSLVVEQDNGLQVSDLFLDTLENSSEEENMNAKSDKVETAGALFDYEELQEDLEDSEFTGWRAGLQEDTLEYNAKAKTAYDIFVPKSYIRTKVLKSKDGVYTASIGGSKWSGDIMTLYKAAKKRFMPGSDTLLFIGSKVLKISNIAGTTEDLDWLDKTIIAGKEAD